MNELILKDSRSLSLHMGETVYVGDNRITKLTVTLPDTIGGYPRAECQIELRAYIGRDEFLSYSVASADAQTELRLENDLTDAARNVELTMIITHNGNVIGRTNTVTLTVAKAKDGGEELTPREQFDAVISAQRETITQQAATIAEQSETITQQGETITHKNEQITELSGEVSELTTENTRLETLTETQRQTIQNMIDNPPQPRLETPDMLVPEEETVQYTPSEGYDGFSSVTVKGNKYLNVDLQKFLARDIDVDLEIKADSIGNYLCYGQTGLITCRMTGNPTSIGVSAFEGCIALQEVVLPDGLINIGLNAFKNCQSLREINFPSSLKAIAIQAFSNSKITDFILPHGFESLGYELFYSSTRSPLANVYLPNTLTSIGTMYGGPFKGCSSVSNLILENGFDCGGLNISSSTLYSVETIVSWLEALADRTGLTAYTLTMGTTNLNKLTAEQIAIATAKNWNLA